MLHKEWSLIANSLLVQMGTGLFLFWGIFRQIAWDSADRASAANVVTLAMALAGLLLALGMLTSLFHLGNPLRAYRAITNMRDSWLSREVFFTAAFFGLWLIDFICQRYGIYVRALSWLTMIAAILSVVSMASIYYSTGNRGWNGFNTYTSFFASVIIMGGAGTAALIAASEHLSAPLTNLLKISMLLLIVSVVIKLGLQIAMIFTFTSVDIAWSLDTLVGKIDNDKVRARRYTSFTLWAIVLSLGGAVIGLAAFGSPDPQSVATLLVASAVLVLAGEIFARVGFYILGMSDETETTHKLSVKRRDTQLYSSPNRS